MAPSPTADANRLMEPFLTESAHLIGITYETKTRTLGFELDSADHRIVGPAEVWTLEEPDH
jgi:hypothetical protein